LRAVPAGDRRHALRRGGRAAESFRLRRTLRSARRLTRDRLGRFSEGACAMKGNAKIIEALNEILTAELTGINQYFIHAKMCANWGYHRLAKKNREESIGEMKHADELIERILFLEGVPNLQRLGKVRVGEKAVEQLKLDRQLEADAVASLNKAIALAVEHGDNGTRELLEELLTSEEDHLDWLETQLELVKQVGEENYLAQQIHES
jgi:bacterioferritin